MKSSSVIISAAVAMAGSLFAENKIEIPFSKPVEWKDLRPWPKEEPPVPTEAQMIEKYKCEKVSDVAQFGGADWENVIGMVSGVTLEEACQIAEKNEQIDFFFYMKGEQMALQNGSAFRVFHKSDAVFFSGKPWWGSAPGFADGYIVKRKAAEEVVSN